MKTKTNKGEKMSMSEATKAKIDGFRKGNVPNDVLEQKYGQSIHSDVINEIIQESCYLNNMLLNIPGKNSEKEIQTSWNIGEAYISRINGRFSELTKSITKNNYRLTKKENFDSFESWLQNVVWYGNKRGNYLNDFASF